MLAPLLDAVRSSAKARKARANGLTSCMPTRVTTSRIAARLAPARASSTALQGAASTRAGSIRRWARRVCNAADFLNWPADQLPVLRLVEVLIFWGLRLGFGMVADRRHHGEGWQDQQDMAMPGLNIQAIVSLCEDRPENRVPPRQTQSTCPHPEPRSASRQTARGKPARTDCCWRNPTCGRCW